jgi:D-sedoheptulose 7-phosphate isomerase
LTGHLEAYFANLQNALASVNCTGPRGEKLTRDEAYERALEMAIASAQAGCKQIFIGNGGSAAIASHMAIDFSKNGGLPAVCFNDGAALTCLGNDFGYEEVFSRQIQFHARPGDILFAISSSGASKNILNAVEAAFEKGCRVVTLSGFSPANPLRSLGEVNFHVAVYEYGIVEIAHAALIHALVELKRAIGDCVLIQAAD